MGNGNQFRNNGRDNVDFQSRRRSAEGHDTRNDNRTAGPRRHSVNPTNQILGHEDRILACKKMLSGAPDVYPLFDAEFGVEQHHSGEFMIMRYLGGTSACELRDGGLRDGFFVPLGTIWGASSNAEFQFRDDDQGFLTKFLLSQVPVKEAMRLLKTERRTQRVEQSANVRAKYDNVSTVVKPAKAGPPKLASLEQLLTVNFGVFQHASGVDIVVAAGPGKRGPVFWAQNPVEGHPLVAVADGNIFATVYDVETYPSEQTNPIEGKALLARVFRQWMREIFREEDLLPPADEQVKDTSPAFANSSMASVDAEHAATEAPAVETATNVVGILDGAPPRSRRKTKAGGATAQA